MVFSSMVFLWLFLPISLVSYYIVWISTKKIAIANVILLLLSLSFYTWGEPIYIWVMILEIVINYFVGIALKNARNKKIFLLIGLLADLGLLIYFKYFTFFISILSSWFHLKVAWQEIHLPIGISFFTFQAMSYIVDIYMGKYNSEKNIVNVALYISFFPQLIAGPIVKYEDIGRQIQMRSHSIEKIAKGIRRFCYGLGKKVIIANMLAETVDKIAALDIEQVSGIMAWIVAIFFSLQIYYDFSGYSDMAIGLGKMFGFHIQENFVYPYLSKSITEFWRRWHVSLGEWFKQYVYIPLGGNRRGRLRTYINLAVVFWLTGIWHGASWNFFFWGGIYYSFFIIIERMGVEKLLSKTTVFAHIYTKLVFVYGWVLFYFTNMGNVLAYWKRMCMPWRYMHFSSSLFELVDKRTCLISFLAVMGCGVIQVVFKRSTEITAFKYGRLELMYCMIIVMLCFLRLAGNTYNPFIYFRF